jgi:hypothetical protein
MVLVMATKLKEYLVVLNSHSNLNHTISFIKKASVYAEAFSCGMQEYLLTFIRGLLTFIAKIYISMQNDTLF